MDMHFSSPEMTKVQHPIRLSLLLTCLTWHLYLMSKVPGNTQTAFYSFYSQSTLRIFLDTLIAQTVQQYPRENHNPLSI